MWGVSEVQINWGLALFREDAILTNEYEPAAWKTLGTTSLAYQNIALLIARAVVGQWIGNMVRV